MLYETPKGFSVKIGFELDHGRFLFEAPPFETEFDYTKNAITGNSIMPCFGTCRNVEGIDDYFGIAIVDKDIPTLIRGYYTDIKIPLYEFCTWDTLNEIMPNKDWNIICYVGYYRPYENVLYATDWREFTIKNLFEAKPFPFWILLLGIPIIYFAVKK